MNHSEFLRRKVDAMQSITHVSQTRDAGHQTEIVKKKAQQTFVATQQSGYVTAVPVITAICPCTPETTFISTVGIPFSRPTSSYVSPCKVQEVVITRSGSVASTNNCCK